MSTPEQPQIIAEQLDTTLRLTISSPSNKNAIDKSMYLALADALNGAADDEAVRAVWIRGADGVFTSGNVVEQFDETVGGDNPPVPQFLHAIARFPKPIVAQVEGAAVGVGATMLLHCDLVYAEKNTKFLLPFVNLGLVPEAGASYLLPRLMGHAKAAELLLLGRLFSAEEALAAGLVVSVLEGDEVAAAAERAAARLGEQPPGALVATKAMLKRPLDGDLHARIDEELAEFLRAMGRPEFEEAYAAFVEKRKPVFK